MSTATTPYCGDIGRPVREVEFEPVDDPAPPVEPTPVPEPSEPAREPVPA